MKSIVEKVLSWKNVISDVIAIADISKSITYGQLGYVLENCSKYLVSLGVSKGDCIMIQAKNSVDFVVGVLSIHYAGGISVPLDPKLPDENLREIQGKTESKILIADDICFDKAMVIPLTNFSDTVFLNDICLAMPRSEQYSDLLFTTGTTGKPKGVLFNHLNLVGVVENLISGSNMDEGTVYLIYGPLNHAFSLRKVYYTLFCGCSVILLDGLADIKLFYNMIDKWHVTATHLLPAAAKMILTLSSKQLAKYADQLIMVESGTAPFAADDMEKLRSILPNTRLYFGYGCSESDSIAKIEFSKYPGKESCVGFPTVHSEVKIVDENRKEVSATRENPGYIACKSIVNMVGYWKEPDLTKEVLQNGFLYTNDLGYFDEEGFLYVLGRKGDVINIGGIKVSAKELEEITLKIQSVEDCAVIPVYDPFTTQAPKLFVQMKENCTYNEKEIRDWLSDNLEMYKWPKYIECIEKIPRTYNGKIQKNQLK